MEQEKSTTTNKILLNEIFESMQGEGPNIGRPSVFVRLGGCNLTCTWCDSKFTWEPTIADNKVAKLSEVIDQIKSYSAKHLVITGGEPLLQQDKIRMILEALPEHTAELETNGSQACNITDLFEQINCSPKLKNSGNKPYSLMIKPSEKRVIYKFVVQSPSDLEEIQNYVAENEIPSQKVYLMPEGQTRAQLLSRNAWVQKVCVDLGFNFTPRLHIMLWDDKRAV